MDNKIIVLIVAAIAAVGLIAGFALLGGGGAPSDEKNLVGEWKAYYAMGYNEEGVYFTEDDPVILDKYDFEVKMASDSLFTATSDAGAFEGTYNKNMMTAIIDNGPSTTTFKASLFTNTLIVNKLVYNGAGAISIVDVIYNHDGISPPADDREPSDPITIPDAFVLSSGVSFNGKSTDLSGDNLKITAQDGPLMKGTMDQQVGTETVVKDFLATMMPMPDEPSTVVVYRVIDEGGIYWIMTYNIADKVLTATMADKSEIYAGTAAAYRIYTLPGAEKAPVPEGADYVGKTWAADTVNRIEDGKVIKSEFPMVLNITSQNGILISGTITFGDEVLDYSAVLGPNGWTYVDCKIPGSEATGSVMLSPDEKTLYVRGIYGEATLEGTHGWKASSYTLKMVEPEPVNAILGEWQCQYAETVDGDGVFKTETRSDGVLQKWDLDVLSAKGGMVLVTFDGATIVGSAPSAYFKSQVSPEMTMMAVVDAKGNLQAHVMTSNDDGTASISNLVYTRGQSATETASTADIKGDYSVVVAEAYDGNAVTKLGGTALNITQQQGTLFKGTMEIEDGGIKTVNVIGYISTAGDSKLGSMFIGNVLSSIVFFDGMIFMNGPTPLGDVFSCVYAPVSAGPVVLPELETVKGTWKNGESNTYSVNGDFAPSPGDAYDMKIIDDKGAFVSGTLGTISFLGIKVLSIDGSMSLRLYPTDGTGGPYPIFVSLNDGGGIRVSLLPGMAYVTDIEESEK